MPPSPPVPQPGVYLAAYHVTPGKLVLYAMDATGQLIARNEYVDPADEAAETLRMRLLLEQDDPGPGCQTAPPRFLRIA